ncbi:hypothetical protein IW261DRAFT_1516966, partial [Armillaria novae-zelandiae]
QSSFFFSLSFGVCVLRYSSLAVCFFCIYCCLVMTLCVLLSLLWSTILYHCILIHCIFQVFTRMYSRQKKRLLSGCMISFV